MGILGAWGRFAFFFRNERRQRRPSVGVVFGGGFELGDLLLGDLAGFFEFELDPVKPSEAQ